MYNYSQIDPAECEFIPVASAEELSDGERLFVEIDDRSLVVFKVSGACFAIDDVCSHDDGPLGDGDLVGFEVSCPRHGAKFDVRTGKAISLPAIVDIFAYPVRIQNGQIEIGIPAELG